MKHKRNKAFIGAAIGAVASIASSLIGARRQKKATEREAREKRLQQNINYGQEYAAAQTSALANQDYVDEYKDKIVLKKGGKLKSKGDRLEREKQFKCGGKRK